MKREIKFSKDILKKSRYWKFQDFHNLMQYRVTNILLISSLYDNYLFEEDGRLYELIRKEYLGLNLSHAPEITHVTRAKEAVQMLEGDSNFQLILVTMHIEDSTPVKFAELLKSKGIDIPVVLIGFYNRQLAEMLNSGEKSIFDKIFVWTGDYRLIIGIIKFIEDRRNIENDVETMGVQVILVVEDDVKFYSAFMPVIYTELFRQSQNLVDESINLSHKFLRLRSRSKIILCSDYEEAEKYYKRYKDNIQGIITDVSFPKRGKLDPKAGIKFAKQIKKDYSDIPVVLQSNNPDNEEIAYSLGASFLLKESPTLLHDLNKFMRDHFSFGDFIFRNENGNEVDRARNLYELEDKLKTIPIESLNYHASRNHFSNWLKARTEFYLAHNLRPKKVTDFRTSEQLRKLLIDTVSEFRINRQRAVISDFNREAFGSSATFTRVGGGSIGGKARGLSFINYLIHTLDIRNKFEDTEISIPPLLVLGTEIFDDFMDKNSLTEFALRTDDDNQLVKKFIKAEYFPDDIIESLFEFLSVVNTPIAVRSSSLLEDSQGQPFAGVYETIMLPNNDADINVRFGHLLQAIKRIYASTFFSSAKKYIMMTTYRLEDEKMAVIIQTLSGAEHNRKFYPEISGVARSFDFYPTPPIKASDGIAAVGLGLGRVITDGGNVVRFCPKYPKHLIQFYDVEKTLKYSQRNFYALDLKRVKNVRIISENTFISEFDLQIAYKDGTLNQTGSTYSLQNHSIYDGVSREGVKLFTLAPILKFSAFPLADILDMLLKLGRWGMGSPVEIEFAVNLSKSEVGKKQFSVLQVRPLVITDETFDLDMNEFDPADILCSSTKALGNGRIEVIKDIVFVDKENFERAESRSAAKEITEFNSKLVKEGRPYLLIVLGRLGTLDPWLGIPVTWENICGAKVIVETNFDDMIVEPSQGSHFFQNLTSFQVGYFTVDEKRGEGFLNYDWLQAQNLEKGHFVHRIKLENPLTVLIDGKKNAGVILKSENES